MIKTYMVVFLAAISINYSAARQCMHNGDPNDVVRGVHLRNDHHVHVSMRAARFEPIRISLFYDRNIPANVLNKIQTTMSDVTTYFGQILKVNAVGSPLLLDRKCLGTSSIISGINYCNTGCVANPSCLQYLIPADHLQACRSCSGGKCTTTGVSGRGVPNTNYMMYVTAVNASCGGDTNFLAYAYFCQTESSLDRPIAGSINFCPDTVITKDSIGLLDVAKHETLHALGFVKDSFAFWRDQNGNPRTPRDPKTNLPRTVNGEYDTSSTVITYTYTNWVVIRGAISHQVKLVVTPAVLEKARAYFNCPTLMGVELENQGVTGVALNHWDKRILGNELMTSDYTGNSKLSVLTLALLQDTGWYQVDYSKADMLTWGRNAGCQFAAGSCGGYIASRVTSRSSVEPFCNTVTDPSKPLQLGCTSDRDAVGYCTLVKLDPPPPADYQYFPSLGPSYGGNVVVADYCPFYQVFTYLDGRGTSCANIANAPKDVNYLGETYGPSSMCLYQGSKKWVVTTVSTGKVNVPMADNSGAGCYQLTSAGGSTTITVLNKSYQCARSGQQIDIDMTLNGLRYQGSLLCP